MFINDLSNDKDNHLIIAAIINDIIENIISTSLINNNVSNNKIESLVDLNQSNLIINKNYEKSADDVDHITTSIHINDAKNEGSVRYIYY